MKTLIERLSFAHLCTGEPLFKEAAQAIDTVEREAIEADTYGKRTGEPRDWGYSEGLTRAVDILTGLGDDEVPVGQD